MPLYTGVNGANREVKKLYTGVGGANKAVKELYTGVSGANRKVFSREIDFYRNASNPYQFMHRDTFGDNYVKGTVTFGQNMVVETKEGNPTYLVTYLPTDVTGYTKLCITYDATIKDPISGYDLHQPYMYIAFGRDRGSGLTLYSRDKSTYREQSGTNKLIELPIDGNSGQKYIEIQVNCAYDRYEYDDGNSSTTFFNTLFTITRVWME